MNNSLDNLKVCANFTNSDKVFSQSFYLWIELRLQTFFAVVGILINLFSIFVLARKEMRNSFNLLLAFLSLFDTSFLLTIILKTFRKAIASGFDCYWSVFAYGIYPLQKISISGSIFMTVAISGERYFAIHCPIDYYKSMNKANAIRNRWIKYVVPVLFLSLLFNSTSFFELSVSRFNETSPSNIMVTPLRTNVIYINYNYWSGLFVQGIIPLFLLLFFNFKLFVDIRERRRRRQLRQNATKGGGAKQSPKKRVCLQESSRRMEDSLALIFVGFTFVFLICHSPRILLNIYEILYLERLIHCSSVGRQAFYPWVYSAIRISHLLLVINSALNMLVYCFFSLKFRQECRKLFACIFKK